MKEESIFNAVYKEKGLKTVKGMMSLIQKYADAYSKHSKTELMIKAQIEDELYLWRERLKRACKAFNEETEHTEALHGELEALCMYMGAIEKKYGDKLFTREGLEQAKELVREQKD